MGGLKALLVRHLVVGVGMDHFLQKSKDVYDVMNCKRVARRIAEWLES